MAALRGLAVVIPSLHNPECFRNLQKKHVYLLNSDGARGIDFSAEDGIDLFVMVSSPNLRAYQQLLGRVGRYNQPCSRAMAHSVRMIDVKSEQNLNGEVARRTDVIKARAEQLN